MPTPPFPIEEAARLAALYRQAVQDGAADTLAGERVTTGSVSAITVVMAETGYGRSRVRRQVEHVLKPAPAPQPRSAQPKPRIRVKAGSAPLAELSVVLEARRVADAAEALRRRVRELEDRLMDEQDWRHKMQCLQRDSLEAPEWHPSSNAKHETSLTPILFTSDFQCGEVIRSDELDGINEYNMDIFAERYQAMIDRTITIARHHTGATEIPGIVYLRGGDAISGEIHEELAETNDLSAIPAVRWLRQHEREGIRRLKSEFGRVRVISIPGNHGRTTRKPHAKNYGERSFETLLGWWLADCFEKDPDVTFFMPPSGDALFDVCGWNFLLSHGDRMGSRGGQGFIGPAATIARGHQKLMSNYALTKRPVDVILTGHLHTSLKLSHGYANGALAGYSEYARDFRAAPDAPRQWLLFAHEQHMVSHAFELQLGPLPRRSAVMAAL